MAGTLVGLRADDSIENIIHTFVDVPNTSVLVAKSNPQRRYILFVNDSPTDMYLSFDKDAALHQGVRLNKGGDRMEFSLCHTNLYPGDVYAIQERNQPQRLLVTEGE